MSPAVADRATSYFLYHYVVGAKNGLGNGPSQGAHEYLPLLLEKQKSAGTLGQVVSAAGLAAMANAGASMSWRYEAYRLYGKAIRQLQTDLQDPVRMKSDSTLASILLMATFEVRPRLHTLELIVSII